MVKMFTGIKAFDGVIFHKVYIFFLFFSPIHANTRHQ